MISLKARLLTEQRLTANVDKDLRKQLEMQAELERVNQDAKVDRGNCTTMKEGITRYNKTFL